MDYIDMLRWPAMLVSGARLVARRFAIETQAHYRLLDFPAEQCPVGYLGLAHSGGVHAHRAADWRSQP